MQFMIKAPRWLNWKIGMIAVWMVATLSLASWWMWLGLSYTDQLLRLSPAPNEHLERQREMLLGEGFFWMVLLLAGGLALIGFVLREDRRNKAVKDFFAAFTHDLKTSIASLRLQAESLQEDMQGSASPLIHRLVADSVRLQMQLENSLFLAPKGQLQLHLEPISLEAVVEQLALQWPNAKIELKNPCMVIGDERALATVFANLIQNALVHGKATHVVIEAKPQDGDSKKVWLEITDNGRGFQGDVRKLAQPYVRHTPTSGSGIGLYIARKLTRTMRGELLFRGNQRQFCAQLCLLRELA